ASWSALFLLAVLPEQRLVSADRAPWPGIRVRKRRSACRQTEKTQRLACPRRATRRRFGISGRPAVTPGPGAASAAGPQSATKKGADAGGADPAARRPGSPAGDRRGL